MDLLEEIQDEEDLQELPYRDENGEIVPGESPELSELDMILDRVQDNLQQAFRKFSTSYPDEAIEIDYLLETMKTIKWFELPTVEVMGQLDDLHDAIMTLLASATVKRRLKNNAN